MRLRSGDVVLQEFGPALTDVVHVLRNHASVRERMRDSRPISRESHERWVHDNLVAERRLALFVVYGREEPVGLALLRNFRGATAEIGVMIVEAERRRLASYKAVHLIGYYGFEVLALERLLSYVPLHNAAALEFNLRCGLERTGAPSDTYHELMLTCETSRTHPTHRRFRRKYPIDIQSD